MADMQLKVSAKWAEAQGIVGLELVSIDGGPLPAADAGAHIDVHLLGGLTRSYSLCGNPADVSRYELGVLRESDSRGGSAAMHESVNEGDTLEVDFPKNHFPLAAMGQRHALFAGGIGVTPLLAMVVTCQARGDAVRMHYAMRSRARGAYLGRLQAMLGSALQVHVDDEVGAAFDAVAAVSTLSPDTHVYVCGPKPFMDAVLAAARAAGWAESHLHWEYFGNEAAAQSGESQGFDVVLKGSALTVHVPVGQTIVQACAGAGVDILVSCEQGVCGTCITSVLEGTPDHKDLYLTPQEQAAGQLILPCCSRSKTPILVLDL
jgi:vanillate monooxygenase ferredoxin subunit